MSVDGPAKAVATLRAVCLSFLEVVVFECGELGIVILARHGEQFMIPAELHVCWVRI